MMAYLEPAEIEIEWRKSGKGICIIVEGETAQDDAWYFGEWFNNRAQDFTFFPQNGWEQVVAAVTHLRPALGAKKVYGIRDRDFEPSVVLEPFPENGILCTPKYTLENYLLDPVYWYEVIKHFARRNRKPGWNSVDEIAETIKKLYSECLPISAYNFCLYFACQQDNQAFGLLPRNKTRYYESPRALQGRNVSELLGDLTNTMGLKDNLSEIYRQRLDSLINSDFGIWEQQVSGKYVLKLMRDPKFFPLEVTEKSWIGVLDAYMEHCMTPPDDLSRILDAIYRNSQTP